MKLEVIVSSDLAWKDAPSLTALNIFRRFGLPVVEVAEGDDHVSLQNVGCDQALRIKYDIMLIIYELIDWRAIGDLLTPWPAEDQQKIRDHLEMMLQAKIIQIAGLGEVEEEADGKSSAAPSSL
jgi:hypothetical protein